MHRGCHDRSRCIGAACGARAGRSAAPRSESLRPPEKRRSVAPDRAAGCAIGGFSNGIQKSETVKKENARVVSCDGKGFAQNADEVFAHFSNRKCFRRFICIWFLSGRQHCSGEGSHRLLLSRNGQLLSALPTSPGISTGSRQQENLTAPEYRPGISAYSCAGARRFACGAVLHSH